jgi:imidazolonepropionase
MMAARRCCGWSNPHTQLVWEGATLDDVEMRLQGKSYMEIMAAGGGIAATLQTPAQPDSRSARPNPGARLLLCPWHTTLEAKGLWIGR